MFLITRSTNYHADPYWIVWIHTGVTKDVPNVLWAAVKYLVTNACTQANKHTHSHTHTRTNHQVVVVVIKQTASPHQCTTWKAVEMTPVIPAGIVYLSHQGSDTSLLSPNLIILGDTLWTLWGWPPWLTVQERCSYPPERHSDPWLVHQSLKQLFWTEPWAHTALSFSSAGHRL